VKHPSTIALLISAALAGCATDSARLAQGQQRYRCDQGIEFTVRFGPDTAMLDAGSSGYDLLYRDAGGVTPQQSVYSNPRLRAEFGLGSTQSEALLRYLGSPRVARCTRG
jgi:hypothetical protein